MSERTTHTHAFKARLTMRAPFVVLPRRFSRHSSLVFSREERYEFIRAKYVEKRYVMNTCADERDLLSDLEHAVNNRDLQQLLQVYAENVDLAAPLPTSVRCMIMCYIVKF